jgi:predicted esterase
MKILLLHGFLGNSNTKAKLLALHGADVCKPKLSNWSIKRAIRQAQEAHDLFQPDCIVGSSRGGAIAMGLTTDKHLVLLSPAWRLFGDKRYTENETTIIHGLNDTVIPLKDSIALRNESLRATLKIVNDNHRLDRRGLLELLKVCAGFNLSRPKLIQ